MVQETILTSPLFRDYILPFLFIFVVLFAILQKTKVLGENKQIDALVSFSIALIVIGFVYPVGVITNLILYFSIAIVVILLFLLMYGFVATDENKGFKAPDWVKWTFGILIVISLTIAVLWATGALNFILGFIYYSPSASSWISNIIFIVIIAVALALILKPTVK